MDVIALVGVKSSLTGTVVVARGEWVEMSRGGGSAAETVKLPMRPVQSRLEKSDLPAQ